MELEIYSHDLKMLSALAMFKDDNDKAYKIFESLSSSKAKLVAKYILDPPTEEDGENEYSIFAESIVNRLS